MKGETITTLTSNAGDRFHLTGLNVLYVCRPGDYCNSLPAMRRFGRTMGNVYF